MVKVSGKMYILINILMILAMLCIIPVIMIAPHIPIFFLVSLIMIGIMFHFIFTKYVYLEVDYKD